MQVFNENNMLTKFIKNLLQDTYVPSVKIWKPNMSIIKGFTYISKDYIIKAKKSWPTNFEIPKGEYDITNNQVTINNITYYINDKILYKDNNHTKTITDFTYEVIGNNEKVKILIDQLPIEAPKGLLDIKYFEVLGNYVDGEFYGGLTSNYISSTFNYDAKTHYYLGNYLRMIRDLHDIDLMSYYNCWGGAFSDKIRISLKKQIKNNTEQTVVNIIENNNKKDGLKTLLVPIKFNQKYTIFTNCNMPIEICPIYFNGLNSYEVNNTESMKISSINNYRKIDRISITQPYVYDGINIAATEDNGTLLYHEKYLILLIQIPESVNFNVIILEGDYSDIKLINNNNFKNKLPRVIKKDIFKGKIKAISYPSLIHVVGNENYAFSDRLIEYLLLNVITKNDENGNNIKRIQKYNSSYKCKRLNGIQYDMYNSKWGVWDNSLREFNYNLVTNNFKDDGPFQNTGLFLDINGYIDKDSEKIILRGKEDNV